MREADFPSLLLTSEGPAAQGAFARAQAEFLEPDGAWVARLEGARVIRRWQEAMYAGAH